MTKKTALITGGNRGIGFALTQQLVADNYDVDVLCRQSSEQLEALPVQIYESIELTESKALIAIQQKLSNKRYDLIINNAGILERETLETFDKKEKDQILNQFKINSLAPFELTQLFYKQLKQPSKLIFITSRMGSIEDNQSGQRYGYRMSKAALNAMAKSLAIDLSPLDISVGIFHPGWVKTEMTNYTGHAEPSIAAKQLYERIKDLSPKTSGQFVHADGTSLPW